jgi:peptidoglycan-associated lipoprotein
MFKMKSLTLPLCLVFALALTACGTSTKKKKGANGEDLNLEGSNQGLSLELNGDSDSGKAGSLSTIYFAYDSASLSEGSRETLKANAEFLKSNPTVEVQVEGHCDERGGVQYNIALGERRAKSVKDYLVALGVSREKVTTISFGKERPVAFGHDESAWSKNRRGNFVVTAK